MTPAEALEKAWSPLLGGEDAERAMSAARAIASDLAPGHGPSGRPGARG